MAKINKIIQSLGAGELSPLMDCRIDQQKYQLGCRTMENFYPLVYGGAERRPGTIYVGEAKDSSAKILLVPFVYSTSIAYVLEFGNQYIRFYKDEGRLVGSLLADTADWVTATAYVIGDFVKVSTNIYRCIISHTSGDSHATPPGNTTDWTAADLTADSYPIYEVVSPYLTADLFELKFEPSNDVLWIAHPDYEPRKLSRVSASTFTLTEEAFADGPFIDQNTDSAATISIAEIGGGGTAEGASVTLTAAGCTPFVTGTTAGHSPSGTSPTSKSLTGALFRLVHAIEEQSVIKKFTAISQTSASLLVYEDVHWDFVTNGTWTGQIKLERSYDNSVWETVHTITSEDNANTKVDMTETENNAYYRMSSSLGAAAAWKGTANCQFSVRDHNHIGVVEITAVASTTVATATVIVAPGNTTATHRWSEGYWSNKNGWPSVVTISPEERLTYAGSTKYPLTLWGSEIGVYTCMKEGTADNDPIVFTLVGQGQQNAILWLISKDALIMGTAGGEHVLCASMEGKPITPTNVRAEIQSGYGSANIQALVANDAILYVQRGGRKIREMRTPELSDVYVSDDLTVFANHITESSIVQSAFQRAPEPMLWCIRNDGRIAVMSYERAQNVFSWCQVITSTKAGESDFESVAIIPTSGEEDQVWVSVERVINNATKRYIEYFSTRDF